MKKRILLLPLLIFSSAFSREIITIKNEALTAQINMHGAELTSLRSNTSHQEYMWHGDSNYWGRHAPMMFPVCVRFKENRYTYKGQEYEMPLLGIAHNHDFEISKRSEKSVSFKLVSDEKTRQYYPLDFILEVTYSLNGSRLEESYEIKNTGSSIMPFALGSHPAFIYPITDKLTRKDFEITFSESKTVTIPKLEEGLLSHEPIPFLNNESRFNALGKRIPRHGMVILGVEPTRVGIAERGNPPFLEIDFGDFQNVNIWTPLEMPFVSFEPMTGHHDYVDAPDDLEQKKDLIHLEPDQSKTYRFSILIHD